MSASIDCRIVHIPRRTPFRPQISDCARFVIATLFVAALSIVSASAETADPFAPRLVRPGEATSGALLLEAAEPGAYVAAPIIASDVSIEISGPIARTRLTQRFENPTDGWIEGVYVFPLPDMAAIDTLRLQIGDRFIEGVIEERKEAARIYASAKAEGKKASLLEQERANVFTNSVANIGPYETVVVQIEYQERVRIDGDEFSLRFPMVVAPRYNPAPIVQTVGFDEAGWGAVDPVPDRARLEPPYIAPPNGEIAGASESTPAPAGLINPVTLTVDLDAGFPLGDIASAHHQIVVDRPSPRAARLRFAAEAASANRDFELVWRPADGLAPSAALFVEEIDGAAYYVAMVTPPILDADGDGALGAGPATASREIVFVVDTSGSMAGESIRQAKSSLALALKRLERGDAFNIIQFNSRMEQLFPRAREAHPHTIGAALDYVNRLDAGGGTEMLPALRAALSPAGILDDGAARLRQIVFVTDGAIGNEAQLFETIAGRLGENRLFTVGIGSAPNSFFMSRAAEIGRGASVQIGAVDQVAERMGALLEKLAAPVVTDISISWPGGSAEMWPSPAPDVYRGEPLVVAARAKHDGALDESGIASVQGFIGGRPWRAELPISAAAARRGVSKLWARRKIASLELEIARGADRPATEARILETALRHKLISRLTSLVAVDVARSRPDNAELQRRDAPLVLPVGWDFGKVFGETGGSRTQRDAVAPAIAAPLKAALNVRPEMDADDETASATGGADHVQLPQGATLADAKLAWGVACLAGAIALLMVGRRRSLQLATKSAGR